MFIEIVEVDGSVRSVSDNAGMRSMYSWIGPGLVWGWFGVGVGLMLE